MRILHLYSDWKWTGPAEPAIQACKGLADRGHHVVFACPAPAMAYKEYVAAKAAELGLTVTTRFGLNRYLKPGPTVHDLVALPYTLWHERFDIVHCHLSHDHIMGGFLARLPGTHRPRIVRSLYRRDVLRASPGNRLLLRLFTDGCVTFTPSFRAAYTSRFGLRPERVALCPMSLDLERFRPGQPARDMRQEFGFPADAPVIGIVGRFQKYRRAETFVQAAARLLRDVPNARFLIIGRSSQIRETVVEPIERLGIQNAVVLSGYRIEDYVDTLRCLDVFSLLMPGFDGTARAVREAMALGKPCVVSDYGMLPEIVQDGRTGRVVPAEPEALAAAWRQVLEDRQAYAAMSAAAVDHVRANCRIDQVGECLEQFYASLLERRGRVPHSP